MNTVAKIDISRRYQGVEITKSNGETYTPEALSTFVAQHICNRFDFTHRKKISILDPSVGDGELSLALLRAIPRNYKGKIELFAFDTNVMALEQARKRIANTFPNCTLHFKNRDFLQFAVEGDRDPDLLSLGEGTDKPSFDLIIANPPYVRTQIMGAYEAQRLAAAFGLAGRVDLYQAFLLAMTKVLSPNGAAGFIVSNRFMTTKGGGTLRAMLHSTLTLREVWDLGDTKLFSTAVLPAVIVANGLGHTKADSVAFTSIYETDGNAEIKVGDPIEALAHTGIIATADGRQFLVKTGVLDSSGDTDAVWRIATVSGDAWMATVQKNTWRTFGHLGKIRVGVKTCADKIFIRHDWEAATDGKLPELLRPLTTHHGAGRYHATVPKKVRHILYPHQVVDGKRSAIDIEKHENAKAYLEKHRGTLEGRTYVIESGRKWYELWVPQDPSAWSAPKLVFRDISERPTFWLDLSGSIVNGDCYWLTTAKESETDLLWLAVAIANSTFIEVFYDHRFNNKLYAGRRRFITQYVEQFPLPDPTTPLSLSIIERAKAIYHANHSPSVESMEQEVDALVWEAFSVSREKSSG